MKLAFDFNFDFNSIKQIFETWGWPGLIISIFLILSVTIIKSKFISNIMTKISDWVIQKFMEKNVSKNIDDKKITDSDIINHDIFNYIDYWTYSKIPTFKFSTEYRTAVFKKYLTLFLKGYKKTLKEYVSSKQYVNMDNAEISKSLLNLINKIIYEYEMEMLASGIPQIIVDKMKIKNDSTISLLMDLIDGICGSQFYHSDNNLLKVYSVLNILLSVLENTISNSESVCNSINGQLKGLEFEGKKEP